MLFPFLPTFDLLVCCMLGAENNYVGCSIRQLYGFICLFVISYLSKTRRFLELYRLDELVTFYETVGFIASSLL